MTQYAKTVTLSAPLLPGDTLTLTVKAPVPVTPPVVITLPPTPPATPPTGSALTSQPTPAGAAPGVGQSITEAGHTVTRLGPMRHSYATRSWQNADGSRALLFTVDGGGRIVYPCHLFDAAWKDLGSFPGYSSIVWSRKDPDLLFALDQGAGRFVQQRVSAPTPKPVGPQFGPNATIGGGEGEGSDDDSLIAVMDGATVTTLNPLTGAFVGRLTWSGDNVKVARSGKYVVLVGAHVIVTNPDLTGARVLWPSGNHGDTWIEAGTDYFVMNNANGVRQFRLSDGAQTQLLPAGTAFEYGHVSGRGPRIALSNHNTPAAVGRPGRDQVVTIEGPNLVTLWAFGHHQGESPYAAQPMACPSRDGKGLIFASEWAGPVSIYWATA